MLTRLREAVTNQIMRVELVQRPPPLAPEGDLQSLEAIHANPDTGENEETPGGGQFGDTLRANSPRNGNGQLTALAATAGAAAASGEIDPKDPSTWGKVQRNAPCPCGSGKKYKHCHGRYA